MSKVQEMLVHSEQPRGSNQDFSNILSGIVFEFRALILCDLLWHLKGGVGNCLFPNDSQILQGLSISSCLSSVYTTRLTQRQSIYLQQNAEGPGREARSDFRNTKKWAAIRQHYKLRSLKSTTEVTLGP